jgi:hypothetical protein
VRPVSRVAACEDPELLKAVLGRPADDGRFPESQRRLVVGLVKRWLPPRPRKGTYRSRAESEAVMATILDDVAATSVRYGDAVVVSDQHLPGNRPRRARPGALRCWRAAVSNPPPPPHRERKAPTPSEVDWMALSPRAKETLKKIAVPVSLGLTYAEVAAQLSVLTPTGTRPPPRASSATG